jgi:hypothetical protein
MFNSLNKNLVVMRWLDKVYPLQSVNEIPKTNKHTNDSITVQNEISKT